MSGDDSLNCLYERIDDLPANWELTPKDRLGEKGVINKKTAYVINEIEDIVLNDNPLFCGKIIFKMKNVLGTDPEYVDYIVFDQSSKEKFNFFKNDSLNIAKIIGKPLKFFFTLDDHVPFAYWEDYTVESWKNGFVDGWINMDEEAVRRCIPHDIREIRIKEYQKVQQIFISSIFPIRKSKNHLDITKFNLLSKLTKKPIIALGGINKNNIKKLNMTNAYGFASINYIKNKNPISNLIL